MNKEKVLINILTRTSNRPIGLYNCLQSIQNQTYNFVNHLISYEDEKDLEGVDLSMLNKLKVEKYNGEVLVAQEGHLHAPYNLYCNQLLSEVKSGWIMFLDDDDHLIHNRVLEEIVSEITKADEDTLFIWQMRFPNGKLLPTNKHFRNRQIERDHIGSPCFIFHSKYKENAKWDQWKASDYRVIKNLHEIIPKTIWIKKLFIQINNFGDFGNRNDISIDYSQKLLFRKSLFWYLIPKKHYIIGGIYLFQIETYKYFLYKNFIKIKKWLKCHK